MEEFVEDDWDSEEEAIMDMMFGDVAIEDQHLDYEEDYEYEEEYEDFID